MQNKRLAIIDKDLCNPARCSEECRIYCPVNRVGKDCVTIHEKSVIDEELCNGCAICVKVCPFKAIKIINLPKELQTTPIHRHGQNSFTLYNLAIPKENNVIGLLGRNGIGKTTCINLLSKIIKPNFGGLNKEVDYKEIIKFFRGTEAQNYFLKLDNHEVRVSIKPQKIDEILKRYDGNVINFLKRFDEKNKLNRFAKKLEIDNIMNRDMKDVSGGELQRIAICACALKDADVYYIDEPSSYLDIKQRLNVCKFIRDLSNEKKSVVVVEHDLILLDYMADLVNIFYGEFGAYGVISKVLGCRTGINSYLSGYLRQENVRFRNKEIKFLSKADQRKVIEEKLTLWPNINKKLGSFNFEAYEGYINKREVVGIIGENGIGKTTFVKILAGVLTPDNSKIDLNIKVSYKPQYLNNDSEELVNSFLKGAMKKHKIELIDGLEIGKLLNRKICELSGGELQKVMIVKALSEEVDLILLDEPSAYLDVEQRLNLAKVLNDFIVNHDMSALVVDHDLLFLSYLSNRLIVFEGLPSENGWAHSPLKVEEGMNLFLKKLDITMRKDVESGRPRINKRGSQLDEKQKKEGRYFY